MTTGDPKSLLTLYRPEFRRGAIAVLPLWMGSFPFAFAYAIVARAKGLSGLETILMSLTVSAGAAQLAIVDLVGDNTGAAAILGTVLLLNLRHVLYGLSLNEVLPARTSPPRPVLAHVISDESYGFTIRDYLDGRGSPAFLFGAGTSIFASFYLATALGTIIGQLIPDPERLGLDFVFPLSFLALLLPLLRKRTDLVVAAVAAMLALGLSRVTSGGLMILGSTVGAATLGATLRMRQARHG